MYAAFPEPVGSAPPVGALWHTALLFSPPVFARPLALELHFTPQMPIEVCARRITPTRPRPLYPSFLVYCFL